MSDQAIGQSSEYPTLATPSFGQLLSERRRTAGLSQTDVARMAGLQRTTIRNLELDITQPAPETLRRLQAISELRLRRAGDAAAHGLPTAPAWTPDAHYAPSYAPLALASEMMAALNAPGGALDQSYLYLDAESALDWLAYANDAAYVTNFRNKAPLDEVSKEVVARSSGVGLDVVALGAGDGRSETRLCQHLADLMPAPPDLRLYLLDVSHGLLHTAFRHAADALTAARISIYPVHGDFYGLPRYPVLTYRPPGDHRARLWALIGHTFGNLADEPEFFGDLAAVARSGDFALLDCQLAWAPASDLAAVRAADPIFSRQLPPSVERWLTGPVRRHCQGNAGVKLEVEASNRCRIPGSYELNFIATATLPDGGSRRFLACRGKRYDLPQLGEALREVGWEPVRVLPFGPEPQRCALLLLRRL